MTLCTKSNLQDTNSRTTADSNFSHQTDTTRGTRNDDESGKLQFNGPFKPIPPRLIETSHDPEWNGCLEPIFSE